MVRKDVRKEKTNERIIQVTYPNFGSEHYYDLHQTT